MTHALLHNLPPRVHLLHPTTSDFLQAFWRLLSTRGNTPG